MICITSAHIKWTDSLRSGTKTFIKFGFVPTLVSLEPLRQLRTVLTNCVQMQYYKKDSVSRLLNHSKWIPRAQSSAAIHYSTHDPK